MIIPELVSHQQRFSVNSCATDDSVESSVIATPRDASPRHHQQSNRFSIIKIVNDDPHPELSHIPAVAPARRRAQTLPSESTVPTTTSMTSTTTSTTTQALTVIPKPIIRQPTVNKSGGSKFRQLWPRIKRIMSSKSNIIPTFQENNKMKQLLETMNIADKKTEYTTKERTIKNWLGKNKARVGPQR